MKRSINRRTILGLLGAALAWFVVVGDANPVVDRGHRVQEATNWFNVTVPAHPFDLILARPENNSITLSVLAYQDMEGFLAYGTQTGAYAMQTPVQRFKKEVPIELVMSGLQANASYYYQFRSRGPSAGGFNSSPEYTFHTARKPFPTKE